MSFDLPSVKHKPRTLTVCPSCRGLPRIVLSGYWLYQWGFNIGDRFLACYAAAGSLLLKIRPAEEDGNFSASSLPQRPQAISPSDAKKFKSHPAQVRTPDGRLPKITITGAWLHEWNIQIGDKVSVTRSDDGNIVITVAMPATQSHEIKTKDKLEDDAVSAIAALAGHRALHPHLYEETPKASRKQILPIQSKKSFSQ